ncbi:hypothetical protein [Rubrivirga sp. IMCC43871]|uniref:hypothetical protein n=1 Tax=Rubrivirga sp. IMCC43871 TaxID=3391575 RepID=UPI00398FCCC6
MLALLLALLTVVPAVPAPQPADAFILVAPRGTPAYDFAQGRENGSTLFAQRKLWRALQQAAELLNEGGERTVTVAVAAGDYDGEFGAGVQKVPQITNP